MIRQALEQAAAKSPLCGQINETVQSLLDALKDAENEVERLQQENALLRAERVEVQVPVRWKGRRAA